jgi:hypothetical protein
MTKNLRVLRHSGSQGKLVSFFFVFLFVSFFFLTTSLSTGKKTLIVSKLEIFSAKKWRRTYVFFDIPVPKVSRFLFFSFFSFVSFFFLTTSLSTEKKNIILVNWKYSVQKNDEETYVLVPKVRQFLVVGSFFVSSLILCFFFNFILTSFSFFFFLVFSSFSFFFSSFFFVLSF